LHYRLPVVLLLVGLLVVTGASGALATQAVLPTSPQALVLRPGDLPRAFTLTASRPISTGELATAFHLQTATLSRSGCTYTYETSFARHGYTGIIGVQDFVTQCKSAAGAHWYYGQVVNTENHTRATRGHFEQFPVGYIGDERTGYVYTITEQYVTVMAHITLFRRGPYVAQVLALSGEGGLLPGQAVHFAQIIDQRISQARS
jgi:hypothetical protein